MTTINNDPNNYLLSVVKIGDSEIFFGDFEILTSFLYFDRKDLINKIYLKMFLRLLLYAKYKIDFKNKKHQNDKDNTAIRTQYLKDLNDNISNLDSITSFELSIIYPYIKNICQEIQDESCEQDFKVIIKSFLSNKHDKSPEEITNEIINTIQKNLKSFDILSKKDEFFKNIKSILSNLKFEDNFSDEDKDNYFRKLHETIYETIQNLKEYIKTKKELESYIKEKLDSQQISNVDQNLFDQLTDIISKDKYIIEEEGQQTGEGKGQETKGKGQETKGEREEEREEEGEREEEKQQKFSIEFINKYENLKGLIDSYNNANNKFFNIKEQEGQEAQEAQKLPV